jgi:hypothetical protein
MERNYNRVITVSDSHVAVNFCNGNDLNRSELMPICQEIKEIRRAFSTFSIILGGMQTWLPICVLSKQVLIGGDVCGSLTQALSPILLRVIVILSVN